VIVETSDNRFFAVREYGDPSIQHCWIGYEVKKRKDGRYTAKIKTKTPRLTLVRKAASKIIEA
jgi:hypothetical protein